MNFTTVDTSQLSHQQFPSSFAEDPMGVTVNIINTAEAALREMNSSKNKNGQLQLQPQPIYQSQVYYGHPLTTATTTVPMTAAEVSRQPQPLYYNLNIVESHHVQPPPPQQQQQQQRSQQVMGQPLGGVNYVGALQGHHQQQQVPIQHSHLPPPPPVVVKVERGAARPPKVQKKSKSSSVSLQQNSTKKKKKEGVKKPKKKSPKKWREEQNRKFVCRFCSAGFSSQEYLSSHMNTVHIDKLKFQCSHCAKRFARSDQKNRHEAIHNPNRFQDKLKYPCHHCTKKFARSDQRKRHEAIHDPNRFQGEPKFSCEFCDKKYHLKGSLDGHRKRQHLGYVWKRKPKKQQ